MRPFGFRTKLLLAMAASSLIPVVVMWIIFIRSLESFSSLMGTFADHTSAESFSIEFNLMMWKLGLVDLAVLLIVLGIMLIVTKRLARSIASPIVELADAMAEYKPGEHFQVEVKTEDEVGELAKRFQTMTQTISTLQANLEQFKQNVSTVSGEMDEENLSEEEKEHKAGELQKALEGLQKLNQNTDDLLSLVRHELKTPLTSIIASTEALMSDLPFAPERKEAFICIIQDEARRLTRLINDMMDLSRLDGSNAPIRLKPLNLPEFIRHVVLANQPISDAKRQSLLVLPMPEDERLQIVMADEDRLTQLLTNILDNAFKFTPECGQITVGLDLIERNINGEVKNFACVSVRDTGCGIDPLMRDKIFEKYAQLKTMQPAPEGQGLGMAIAKWIAEQHGGEIWFASKPGEGTTFHFSLPVQQTAAE